MIIGRNGIGKSSVLKALRIAASCYYGGFFKKYKELKPVYIEPVLDIRRDESLNYTHSELQPCEVTAGYARNDQEIIRWTRSIESKGNTNKYLKDITKLAEDQALAETAKDSHYPVILYFGTGRLWNQANAQIKKKSSRPRVLDGYIRCCDENVEIKTVLAWFKKIYFRNLNHEENKELKATLDALSIVFPDWKKIEYNEEFDTISGVFENDNNFNSIPYTLLSDGQQVLVNIALEICYRSLTLAPNAISLDTEANRYSILANGIVMIDELDMHLHVSWQREIIQRLVTAFPNIQFFATTHSPVLIQSCPAAWLHVLDPDQERIDLDPQSLSTSQVQEQIQQVVPRSVEFQERYSMGEDYLRILQTPAETPEALEQKRAQLDELEELVSDATTLASLRLKRELRAPNTLMHEANR